MRQYFIRNISIVILSCLISLAADARDLTQLLDYSINDLKNTIVQSVSRKEENSFETPAATYVLTSEQIRRSGAATVPEALRLVPGVNVARIDANKWAVTIRGFNRQLANKLLVLVDGRTVYTPLFAGTYWDEQDYPLDDIEKIEIVRGPGATTWGSNAVNGVINIITKKAQFTQGNSISILYGNAEKIASFRTGGETDDNKFYRTYGKFTHLDELKRAGSNAGASDTTNIGRSGFRVDWEDADKEFFIHGEMYKGAEDYQYFFPGISSFKGSERLAGGHLLGNISHQSDNGHETEIQSYYNFSYRDNAFLELYHHTLDIDVTHHFPFQDRHIFSMGGGIRYIKDSILSKAISGTTYTEYQPPRSDEIALNFFIQDKYALVDEYLYLTVGSKFEYNYYTALEFQPNARLSWLVDDNQTFWGAFSKASRTPSRGERGLTLTGSFLPPNALGLGSPSGFVEFAGNDDFEAETLLAYELGYRVTPTERLYIDATVFLNDYDNFRTFERSSGTPIAPTVLALSIDNAASAYSYGMEVSAKAQMLRNWNVTLNYSMLDIKVDTNSGSTDTTANSNEKLAPSHSVGLLSRYNLSPEISLDNNLTYVSKLSNINIPAYWRFDSRAAWQLNEELAIELVGQNLLDSYHPEFSGALFGGTTEVGRSVYARLTVNF